MTPAEMTLKINPHIQLQWLQLQWPNSSNSNSPNSKFNSQYLAHSDYNHNTHFKHNFLSDPTHSQWPYHKPVSHPHFQWSCSVHYHLNIIAVQSHIRSPWWVLWNLLAQMYNHQYRRWSAEICVLYISLHMNSVNVKSKLMQLRKWNMTRSAAIPWIPIGSGCYEIVIQGGKQREDLNPDLDQKKFQMQLASLSTGFMIEKEISIDRNNFQQIIKAWNSLHLCQDHQGQYAQLQLGQQLSLLHSKESANWRTVRTVKSNMRLTLKDHHNASHPSDTLFFIIGNSCPRNVCVAYEYRSLAAFQKASWG